MTRLRTTVGRAAVAILVTVLGATQFPALAEAAIPARLPSPPAMAGARGADESAVVTWTPPSTGAGKITGYVIEWSLDAGTTWPEANRLVAADSARSATVTGLVNGLRYAFRVSSRSDSGTGRPTSPVIATPVGPPGAPTDLIAEPGDGSLSVRWTAPVDLGGARAIRDYTVEWSANGADWQSKTITDTWTMLFDLINGTRYRVRVAARSAGGRGEWTTLEPGVRPRTTPARPTAITATGGTNSVTIGWNPGGTGGAPIRSYRIRWTGPDEVTQEQVVDGSLRTMTVTTIPGETAVTVAAINSSGVGRAARATTTVWSQDITKPQGVEVGATSQGFQLTWTAPTVTEGLSGTAIAIRFVDGTGQPTGDWKLVATMPATDTSATLGAVTGSRAIFRLRSLRRDGATSAWTPATPARMATAARPLPVSLAFTHDGESRTAQALWSPPSTDTVGALNVTGYEAQYRQPGSTSWTAITGQSPVEISTAAWADGTATLRVRSLLGTRHSDWATTTVAITTSVPGPPTAANATGGVGTITVTWTPGTTGGTPITGVKVRYRVPSSSLWTAEVDLPSADVAAGTSTLSGMGAGSWEVQIAMVNTKGTGIWVPAGAVTTT